MYRLRNLNPGSYFIRAIGKPPRDINSNQLIPTLYPSAHDARDAEPIEIGPMGMNSEAHIVLNPAVSVRVSGLVLKPKEIDVLPPTVCLYANDITEAGLESSRLCSQVAADGSFGISRVLPGAYHVAAFVKQEGSLWFASTEVTIREQPLENLKLSLERAGTISGRLKESKTEAPAGFPNGIRFFLTPLEPMGFIVNAGDMAKLRSDGTFSFEGVVPGRYRMVSDVSTKGFYVAAVFQNNADVRVAGFTVTSGTTTQLELVLGSDVGEIRGTVKTQGNVSGGVAILAPLETSDVMEDFRIVDIDQKGRFRMENVRPGRYLILGLDYAQPSEFLSPTLKQAFANLASPLELKSGQTISIEVPMKSR